MDKISFIFFGTDNFSITVLDQLEKAGFLPRAIVTVPDRPKGRKLVMTPPPAKVWAAERSIPVLQTEKLDGEFIGKLSALNPDLFVVASYGLIIPKVVLDIPKKGTLNVHPSLLPKYRGASPIQTAILNGDLATGVTIMLMDEKMDHGPIVAKEIVRSKKENGEVPKSSELEEELAKEGGRLLAEVLPKWVIGGIESVPQDDSQATFTKMITKSDGEIDLSGDSRKNFLKIRAYEGWPGTFFFSEKGGRRIRVVIKDAELKDGNLVIKRVLPEGGREMSWEEFQRGLK